VRRSVYFKQYALAGLTHELKSPLAAIESAVEFLRAQQDAPRTNRRELSTYVNMIERNSNRLGLFVNDLLQTFDQKTSNVELSVSRTVLQDVTRKAVDCHLTNAQWKNTSLDIQLPDQPVTVNCDSLKIQQVLSNVVGNAVKFTESGKVDIQLDNRGQEILFRVRDNGHGIPSDELPYVFDRFFQGKSGRGAKGTGLGLTIAKLWVEAHGGRIWAESEGEGKGTTVTFTLPVFAEQRLRRDKPPTQESVR
jgi:signal transduction histidine kinase